MMISPINANYSNGYSRMSKSARPSCKSSVQPNFQGKHDCAKIFGGICGGLGTAGALGGIFIMTGGVAIIPTLIYGATCAGMGAAFGHQIDKSENNKKDN